MLFMQYLITLVAIYILQVFHWLCKSSTMNSDVYDPQFDELNC